MGSNLKGAPPGDQKAGIEASTRATKTTGEEAPTQIHQLLAGIKAATEENGRTLAGIKAALEENGRVLCLLLEKIIQQGQSQQTAQATARSRQEQTAEQRKGEEAYADNENDEGNHDDAGAAQARTPTPYSTYRTARRAQPPGIIPLVMNEQREQRSGSYPNPRQFEEKDQ